MASRSPPISTFSALLALDGRERLPGADQQLGLLDELAGGGGEAVEAVVADADDLDFGGGHERLSCMKASTVSCMVDCQWAVGSGNA